MIDQSQRGLSGIFFNRFHHKQFSFSARSERSLDRAKAPSLTDGAFQKDTVKEGGASHTEHNDALKPRHNYYQNASIPTKEDANNTLIDEKQHAHHLQRNYLVTPHRSRSNITRNDSFFSPSQKDYSARKNKESIDKYAKVSFLF